MFEHVHPISHISPPCHCKKRQVRRSFKKLSVALMNASRGRRYRSRSSENGCRKHTRHRSTECHRTYAEQLRQRCGQFVFRYLNISSPFKMDIFQTSWKTVRNWTSFCFDFSRGAEPGGCVELSPLTRHVRDVFCRILFV